MQGRFYTLLFLAVFTPFFASAATTYTLSSGFSSTQGANQWSYYQVQNSAYTQLTWDSASNAWHGGDANFPILGANGSLHPGNASDAVIRWTAPVSGTLNITGTVADTDGTCGDGIVASIAKNGTTLWSATLENGDGVGRSPSVTENVSSGDTVDFIVNRRSEYTCDSTRWDSTIVLTPQKPNDLPALQSLITNAKNAGLSEVVLESKTYRLECGEYCLTLDGVSNITIRGVAGQTKLLVATPKSGAIQWTNSHDVTVRDIIIDYETPPYSQGTIVSVNGTTVVLQVDAGYPPPTDPLFAGENITVVFPPNSKLYKFIGIPGISSGFADIVHSTLTPLGADQWQFTSYGASYLSAGDRMAVRANTGGWVVTFGYSSNITLQNLSIYGGPMIAFVFGGNSGAITLDHLTIRQSPGTNRLLSTGADAFHLQDNAADITLSNSWVEGMGDDGWNAYMIGVQALSKSGLSANQLRIEGPARGLAIRAGDQVKIMNASKTVQRLAGATAVVQGVASDGGGYILTLDRSTSEVAAGDFVYSPRIAGNVTLTNNHFGPLRGAIRIRGGGVVTNNTFEDARNAMLLYSMDGWNEGPAWTPPCVSGNQVFGGKVHLIGFGAVDEGQAPEGQCSAPTPPPLSCTLDGINVQSGSSQTFYSSRTVPYGSLCSSVAQARTCTNGTLSGSYQYASCSGAGNICTPDWSCGVWNQCSVSGSQSRTCTDINACGVTTGKPAESQRCTSTLVASSTATSTTTQTVAQKIAALLEQIKQLQAIIAKLTGKSPAPVATTPPTPPTVTYNGKCPVFSRTLSRGMRGDDVSALQQFFFDRYQGFPTPTGFFGSVTEAALKQWQGEHGIEAVGIVGPKTRAAIAACK
ncbi:hypothetical protein A2764_00225 [Candidatus Kaiserbacteria bacterium RIFCSPHIGHO2_01_FULL_55_79]|nr:MAG: hypothetical protein A2764_00225 [Candidatus Kaiserbacteria bacterium RIFCSPHIGHO2_01_FULL_55_79]